MNSDTSVTTRTTTRARKTSSGVKVSTKTRAKRTAPATLDTAASTISPVGAAVSSPPGIAMASAASPPGLDTLMHGAWIVEIEGVGETITELSNVQLGKLLNIALIEISRAGTGEKICVAGNPNDSFEVLSYNLQERSVRARVKQGVATTSLGRVGTNPNAGANLILAPGLPRGHRAPPPKPRVQTNVLGIAQE